MFGVVLLSALVGLAAGTFDPELHAKFRQLPRDQFVQYFNSQNYTWKLTEEPHSNNGRASCVLLDDTFLSGLEVRRHDPAIYSSLPEQFDARQHWSQCSTIGEIYNQGHCQSCWTFSTATVASDRTCIGKGKTVRLSEQEFNCVQPICEPGYLTKAFSFWKEQGLVTLNCIPYDITDTKCVNQCKDTNIDYNNDKHFADNVYAVSSNENDIKAELVKNGPISAAMTVFTDFQENYHSGIYEHKFGEDHGGHAIKLIGYGVENGVNYWLAANSWGNTWGENGFFRIKRNQPEIGFENRLYTGIARN